jgi:hypothetical protein
VQSDTGVASDRLPRLVNGFTSMLVNKAKSDSSVLDLIVYDLTGSGLIEHGGLELPISILVAKSLVLDIFQALENSSFLYSKQ